MHHVTSIDIQYLVNLAPYEWNLNIPKSFKSRLTSDRDIIWATIEILKQNVSQTQQIVDESGEKVHDQNILYPANIIQHTGVMCFMLIQHNCYTSNRGDTKHWWCLCEMLQGCDLKLLENQKDMCIITSHGYIMMCLQV